MNRVAAESHLLLEDSKHERLGLDRRRKKKAEVKWIKWPGVIMDESVSFRSLGLRLKPHRDREWACLSSCWTACSVCSLTSLVM